MSTWLKRILVPAALVAVGFLMGATYSGHLSYQVNMLWASNDRTHVMMWSHDGNDAPCALRADPYGCAQQHMDGEPDEDENGLRTGEH